MKIEFSTREKNFPSWILSIDSFIDTELLLSKVLNFEPKKKYAGISQKKKLN